MSLTKYASLERAQILDVKGTPSRIRSASFAKVADFDAYRTDDGFLYARIRAISSRVNKNHDGWPSIELAGGQDIFDHHTSSADGFTVIADTGREYGFSTFLGKPIFIDHHNSNPDRARGVVVDARFHVDDHKTASLDPYYASDDVDPEHLPGAWIELLLEVDAKSFPKFAKAIVEGSRNPKKGIDGWSMGCFVPGTPITLADGTQKPIETIALGDSILTHSGRVEPVTYLLKRAYHGLVYELNTYGQSQPVRMTDEHPVWIKRVAGRGKDAPQGGTCACGRSFSTRASFGAHLREVRRHNAPGEHSRDAGEAVGWVPANEVREGDYVLTPAPEGVGHPGSYPFARLLGYYLAEGNLGYDRKRFADGRPVFAEWTFAVDELEYQEEVVLLLESLGYRASGPYVKTGAASVRCNSPELAHRLLTYGGQHSWNKRLDSEVLRWTPTNQRAILDTYFNGDGHYRGNHVEAGSASQALAQQLQLLATRAGYRVTPPVRQLSPSAKETGRRAKYVLQATLAELSPQATTRAHITAEGLWRRVERIAIREYEGHVYNFDVEGDDSYVAGDIAVHNCDVERSLCSICKNSATCPEEYCNHVKMKGAYFDYTDPDSKRKTSRKAYENCYGVKFFEISGVFDPADETALSREVRSKTQEETITQNPKEKGLKDAADEQAEEYLEDSARKRKKTASEYGYTCPHCHFQDDTQGGPLPSNCPQCGIGGYTMWNDDPDLQNYFTDPGQQASVAQAYQQQTGGGAAQLERMFQQPAVQHPLGPHTGSVRLAENPLPQSEQEHAPEHVDTLREEEVCPVCGSSMDEDTCDVCFTPETLVRTRDGYVPIASIRPGDFVLSADGDFHRVAEVLERDYHGLLVELRARTMAQPVRVTGNHPFYSLVGHHPTKTTPCSPTRCERSITHPHSKTHHELTWLAANDLHDKSYLATNVPKTSFDRESVAVPAAYHGPIGAYQRNGSTDFGLTPDFLWAIGLYLAEGSVGDRTINYALHRDEVLAQQRLIALFTDLGYTAKLVLRDTKPNNAWVEVYSSTLAEWFPEWLGRGSHNKRIPAELLNLPLERLEHVWRGVLDGDGHNARSQLGQTSPVLALQMTEIAIRRGGEPSIQIDCPEGKKRVYKINGTTVTQTRSVHGYTKRGTWHFADRYLSQIRDKREVPYCGPVFNLRVEGDPTYTVQGVLVHNCGYQEPPDGFGNPDLTKVQDVDVPAAPMDDSRNDAPNLDQTEAGPPPPEATNTPSNPALVAHVTSDMDWELHERTSARINKNERPLVSTDKPQTNEPQEKILSDQLKPVTSRVRTAEDFIAAAGATRRNTMNHTADAASGAPAVAKPDVHTDVTGVGGVDQASNDAASKADAQVDVTAIGGTGVESVAAEQEGANVDQGDEHSKNIEAIHTDTWSGDGPGNGDSLGQRDPVTSEPFPASEDGVRAVSHWIVEGYDDGPFPPDAGIGGGTAVQGVQPVAEQFGERVNVLDHVTSPANNSGQTKTWTGTDGNGVLRQQDPVTNESIALGESQMTDAPNWTSSVHTFTAFKLADLEVDLNLIAADKKYDRVAELERESPQVLAASLKYAQRVRRAAHKTAGVQKLPVMGRSNTEIDLAKTASAQLEVPTEDDSFMFGGV